LRSARRVGAQEGSGWLLPQANWPCPRKTWQVGHFDHQSEIDETRFLSRLETESCSRTAWGRLRLGVFVHPDHGHRSLSHGGEVSGFTSEMSSFRTSALPWLCSQTRTPPVLRERLPRYCAVAAASDDPATPENLRSTQNFEGLQHGTIDRSLFTDNANSISMSKL